MAFSMANVGCGLIFNCFVSRSLSIYFQRQCTLESVLCETSSEWKRELWRKMNVLLLLHASTNCSSVQKCRLVFHSRYSNNNSRYLCWLSVFLFGVCCRDLSKIYYLNSPKRHSAIELHITKCGEIWQTSGTCHAVSKQQTLPNQKKLKHSVQTGLWLKRTPSFEFVFVFIEHWAQHLIA